MSSNDTPQRGYTKALFFSILRQTLHRIGGGRREKRWKKSDCPVCWVAADSASSPGNTSEAYQCQANPTLYTYHRVKYPSTSNLREYYMPKVKFAVFSCAPCFYPNRSCITQRGNSHTHDNCQEEKKKKKVHS